MKKTFTEGELSRLIEMAWEDRTSFEQIEKEYGISQKELIPIMRRNLKHKSFLRWRKRSTDRKTKHEKLLDRDEYRAYCSVQYKYKQNRK